MKKFTIISLIGLLVFTFIGPVQPAQAAAQDEIIYDILVDRFNNGDQTLSDQVDLEDEFTYHGGDILGVTKKLDDLSDAGFTTVNLSSIFANKERGYHGYWIENFEEFDEQLGSIDDLKELVKEAHDRDMKVMIEFVTNFAADSHPFVDDANKADWFKPLTVDVTDETFWLEDVVQFDQSNEEVQDYFIDLARDLQDETNIDGMTLHAVDQMDIDFLDRLTKELIKGDNYFIITGTVLDKEADLEPLFAVEELQAVENPALMETLMDVFKQPDVGLDALDPFLEDQNNNKSLLMADNRTSIRYANLVRDHGRNAMNSWKLALAYTYLTPGVPFVFQGSEVPMYGPGFPESEMLVDFVSADPDLADVFKKYSSLRSQFKRFVNGEVTVKEREAGLTLYELKNDDERIYVAINNDSESHKVRLTEGHEDVQLRSLLHDDTIRMKNDEYVISLERESADVYILQPNQGFNWPFISFIVIVFAAFVGLVVALTIKQKRREKANQ